MQYRILIYESRFHLPRYEGQKNKWEEVREKKKEGEERRKEGRERRGGDRGGKDISEEA